jgi:hypothetical protein
MTMNFLGDRRSFLKGLGGAAALSMMSRSSAGDAVDPVAAAPRPARVDALLERAVSVLEFIPGELHAAIRAEQPGPDLAPFIDNAIRHANSLPGGAALFFPPGAYDVSGIDAVNTDPARFSQALRLVGAGRLVTKIRPVRPGLILLNATGRNAMQIETLQFHSGRHQSEAAIVLGRSQASPNCNGNQFRDVMITGNYRTASVVSIGAESTSWTQCKFENSNPAAHHRCLITSHDPAVLPGRFSPGAAGLILGPNTDNVMFDCEFYTPYEAAMPVLFAGSAGYGMTMCTVIGGSTSHCRLITYRPDSSTFTGPVTWVNPHLEVLGSDNIIHFLDAPPGVSYFRAINSYSGNYVVPSETVILGMDRTRASAQPVLLQSTWTVPLVPWASRNLSFRVFGLADSSVEFRLGDGVGTLEIEGFSSNSHIRAGIQRVAQIVTTPPGS